MGGHDMTTIATDLNIEILKADVIRQLDEQGRPPIELLTTLGDNYPDDQIKEAVLRLLQEGRIELTPDRVLRVSHDAT
jgi:hypothetical protein